MPRYQRCTCPGSRPASSAKLPITINRWMWCAWACSSDCVMAWCRQIAPVAEEVGLGVCGHARPVHAAHVLAPAEDLADETLDRRQRRATLAPARFGAFDHLAWRKHL